MRLKKVSFKIKVLIPIITVFVFSVLIIATINYRLLDSTVKTKTNANLDFFNDSVLTQIKHLDIILESTKQTLSEKHIAIAKSIAYILDNSPEKLTPEELQQLAGPLDILELSIADKNGILINSNVEKYIGFDYKLTETTRKYMALADGTLTELAEEPRASMFTDDIKTDINHYSGVSLADGGFIQLGFDANVLNRLQSEINIEMTIQETKLGVNGYGMVLKDGLITAHPDASMQGLDVSGTQWYQAVSAGNGFSWIEIDARKYYAGYKSEGGNTVVGLVAERDYYRPLNQALSETILVLLLSIVIMVAAVYLFLGKLLFPIKTLSYWLGEIAKGDLDAKIEGNYNDEFGEIKDAINSMVVGIKKVTELENELMQSQVSIMLSQIHPHFLYNSLVAIRELCLIDPESASEAVGEFSHYLRGNLDSLSIKNPVTFEQELRHVETYLSLEKRRFQERLNIVYEISCKGFFIPTLTLQPIVENAVRHGVTKREDGGTVIIKTEETDTHTIITVIDDGVGFVPSNPIIQEDRLHIGVENVRSRLESMCGGTLDIKSKPDAGTTAVISIPKGGPQE